MPDFRENYNTSLSKKDEDDFQGWLENSGRAEDLANYDLRGWWKKNGKTNARGHMSDEFKKPNHPTFSDESIYHGVDGYKGGRWKGSDEKGWKFEASKSNVDNMPADQLQEYFSRVEPNAVLELPKAPSRGQVLYDNPTSRVRD